MNAVTLCMFLSCWKAKCCCWLSLSNSPNKNSANSILGKVLISFFVSETAVPGKKVGVAEMEGPLGGGGGSSGQASA